MWVNIKNIKVSAKQYKKIDKKKVAIHVRDIEMGKYIMPIDVHEIEADTFVIAGNGRHRYFAAIEAGEEFIEVCLRSSTG